jgi:hypothetical protein
MLVVFIIFWIKKIIIASIMLIIIVGGIFGGDMIPQAELKVFGMN